MERTDVRRAVGKIVGTELGLKVGTWLDLKGGVSKNKAEVG